MRTELLNVLAEPVTGAPLELEVETREGDRIVTGSLRSTQTGRRYPIVRGIPRFVQDEGYTGNFGRQWNEFREVQLDDATGARRSKDRFEDETRWQDLTGQIVLDAGCGAGRFAVIAAARGAHLVAMDFSSAIDACAQTLAGFPNVDLVQGNLLEPPFRDGAFDKAYSIGVVQHTPDPSRVIENVVRCVRKEGEFSLTIYGRHPWTKLNAKYLIRPLTRRLPQEWLLRAIKASMPVLFPLTDILFRLPVVGRLAEFTIPVANYVHRTDFTREQRYQEAVLDTFDMLAPRFDSPMTWQEVTRALENVHAARWEFQTRVPVNVVGTR